MTGEEETTFMLNSNLRIIDVINSYITVSKCKLYFFNLVNCTQKDQESPSGISVGTGGHRWKEYELERTGVWIPDFRTHTSFAMRGNPISCQICLAGNPEPLSGEKAVQEIPNLTKNW